MICWIFTTTETEKPNITKHKKHKLQNYDEQKNNIAVPKNRTMKKKVKTNSM